MGAAAAAVGTAAIAAGKKLTDLAMETANAGDEIDKTSQKLGMSAESYQKWDYVLSQSGVEITSMTTGLKTLTNQIDDAKNGSADAQARFAKLGISMSDLSSMSREEIFAATITGFQNMSDSTERAALANDLFGKSGQNLTPLFNESVESTKELMQAAEDLGFVMSDKAVKASADFNDSFDTLQKTFGGVKNNIVGELLPGFTTIMYGLSDLLAGNDKAKEEIQNGAKELVSSLSAIFPRIVEILLTLIGAVAEIAPAIIDALVKGVADPAAGGGTLRRHSRTGEQKGTGVLMNTFTFNNQSSADFGLIVAEKDIYSAPAYDQQFVSVPGRNGDVIIDNGRYQNIDVSYTCYCKDLTGNIDAVKLWLCQPGYFKLTDSYDPLYFRYAAFASKLKIDEMLKNVGKAQLVFNCKPFRYSVSGQTKQTLTESGTITNPESFPSLPYIKITASGAVTLNIGSKAYSFTAVPTYLEVNSELMSCYKGSTLYNNRIGFTEFPVLQPGNNSISWTGSVTKVEIIPNWRTL